MTFTSTAWTRSFGVPTWNLPSKRIQRYFPSALPSLCSRSFSRTTSTQLETSSSKQRLPQTLTEKIVQRYATDLPEGKLVRSGDYITCRPQHCMTHDNTAPVALKFRSMGATRVHDAKQIVITLDHDIQNTSPSNMHKYAQIEAFAAEHGLTFFPAGRGIGHQIMVEEGFAWPGTMVVASDSHAVHYGALGCLGTPIVRTDAASIWATGRTFWQVPPIAKVTFTGTLPLGVSGKDVIAALCGLFQSDVLNHAVEFTGSEETLASLPMDSRMTIANMACEWGALSALFPVDRTLERWLRDRATKAAITGNRTNPQRITHERIDKLLANPVTGDYDAVYAKHLYLALNTLSPYVSGPNSVKAITPLRELAQQNIKINRAYIVSCTASRASDLASAAKVFKDAAKANPGTVPRIADGVQLYIAAASAPEQEAAETAGDWQALLDAGAQQLPPGCGPCIGLGRGLLEPGEVGISASNRNFPGRMGARTAQAYLASAEVVAASALRGTISEPDAYKVPADWPGVEYGYGTGAELTTGDKLGNMIQQLDSLIERVESAEGTSTSTTEILPGFPEKISGEILFCDADNLNTDAIYPGKYTYQDGISKEDMAHVCMENYDPGFDGIAKPNDVLVVGFNFGCGSSREQAATAILAKQIPLVVAGSFGNIFTRNSVNNALMTLELPRLVERLRTRFPSPSSTAEAGRHQLTRRTGWTLTWNIKHSVVEVQEGEQGESWAEKVGELPANVQAIIAAGGLESWVRSEISE